MRESGKNEAIAGGGFHHVAMSVCDFEKSVEFYTQGLGMVPCYGWGADGRAEGTADTRALMLDTGAGDYIEIFAGNKRNPAEPAPDGLWMHIALRTTDTAAAYARAMAAGAASHMEPATVSVPGDPPRDFTIAFIKGPDGEIIEFFCNPDL